MRNTRQVAGGMLLAVLAASPVMLQAADATVSTNVRDFMKSYVKPAEKLAKKGEAEPLRRILAAVPAMAQADDQAQWQVIADKALASGDLRASCKACHSEYKKTYKKEYRDSKVEVSAELVDYLKKAL
ncbi:MAG TPA: hypothetical protein VIN71_03190 [Pseudomonadales bacterium]